MSVFFILVGVSICVAGIFLGAFIWNIKTDQYEDQQGAAMRILFDNNIENESSNNKNNSDI